MRYQVKDIEDQIIATLRADTANFAGVNMIDTYAGQISPRMFMDPEYMQGFQRILPFVLVSYQGRTANKDLDRDSSGKTYIHHLTFRIFSGAQSARSTQEAVRNCYDMQAAIYDDLHAKIPKCTPQQLPGYTALSGADITTTGFNPLSALFESGGKDESIVVNLPGIVVYASDFDIKLLA
jgi:hypothetical protein